MRGPHRLIILALALVVVRLAAFGGEAVPSADVKVGILDGVYLRQMRPAGAVAPAEPAGEELAAKPDEKRLAAIETPVYTATLMKSGLIGSIRVGDVELLGADLSIGPPNQTKDMIDSIERPDANSFRMTYRCKPLVTYQFANSQIRITVENRMKNWDFGITYTLGPRAQLVSSKAQLAIDPSPLPLVPGRNLWQADASYIYDDGAKMTVSQSGPGNGINEDENGSLDGFRWGRRCLNAGSKYTYVFSFERGKPGTSILGAPPFALRCGQPYSIFNGGDPPKFKALVKKEHYERVAGKVSDVVVEYQVADFWGKVVDKGSVPVAFRGAVCEVPIELTSRGKLGKGYFELTCALKDGAGKLVPSAASLAFSIVTPTDGLLNLPLPPQAGTYEMDAFLGLRCHREGISLKGIFPVEETLKARDPDQPKPAAGGISEEDLKEAFEATKGDTTSGAADKELADLRMTYEKTGPRWKDLDAQMDRATELSKKYGITAFWLIENVPDWLKAQPAKMKLAMFKIVRRYRDKTKLWMLWNEPNLNMSPADYVKNYLAPLYEGAHKADPAARVFGPDTCGLNPGWLEAVYKAGGKMDIIDMHPYTGHHRGWEEHGMADAWLAVRKVMADHGDGEKQLWSTESGYLWALGRLGKRNVAKFVVRQFPIAESVGIPKDHFFYYYTMMVGYHKMYLVDVNSLVPAGVSARIQSEQLAGTKFAREIPIGKNRKAFLYEGKDEDVLMAWSSDFETTADIGLTTKKLAAFDIMGNLAPDVALAADGKPVTFKLSGYPIYIHVEHGAKIEPAVETLGPNLASEKYWAEQGGGKPAVAASSEAKGAPASRVIDGSWNSENTGSYEGKLWCADKSLKDTGEAWIEIALPQKRTINTVFVYAPSSTCGMPGLRSYKLMVHDAAKDAWAAAGEVKDSEEAWVFEHRFAPVAADKVKLVITDLNNGFFLDDKRPYTDMKPRVAEIEVYESRGAKGN